MSTQGFDELFRATEHAQLMAIVDEQRDEVAALLDGLTEEQARQRVVESETTLLGLVRHACFVEQVWFHEAVTGRTRAQLGLPDHPHDSFLLREEDTIASVSATFARVRAEARDLVAGMSLDDVVEHNRRGPLPLRWIHLHLVREYARHAGHGDILREIILAE